MTAADRTLVRLLHVVALALALSACGGGNAQGTDLPCGSSSPPCADDRAWAGQVRTDAPSMAVIEDDETLIGLGLGFCDTLERVHEDKPLQGPRHDFDRVVDLAPGTLQNFIGVEAAFNEAGRADAKTLVALSVVHFCPEKSF